VRLESSEPLDAQGPGLAYAGQRIVDLDGRDGTQ